MYNTMYQYYDAIQPPETLLPRLLAMEPEPRRAAAPWRVVVPTAACLALAAVAVGLLLPPKQAEPVSLSQPTPQAIQQTAAPETPDTAEMDTPETEQKQVPEIDQQPVLPSANEITAEDKENREALHEPPYRAEYLHTDEGDYLVFTPILLDEDPEIVDITGQLVDGYYAAKLMGLLGAVERYVELQVYDDGSYNLYWEHDPYNDTEWWLKQDSQPNTFEEGYAEYERKKNELIEQQSKDGSAE